MSLALHCNYTLREVARLVGALSRERALQSVKVPNTMVVDTGKAKTDSHNDHLQPARVFSKPSSLVPWGSLGKWRGKFSTNLAVTESSFCIFSGDSTKWRAG